MNQEKIKVELTVRGDTDVLIFYLDSQIHPNGLSVNLNSPSSQSELKVVFSALLTKMVATSISLDFLIADGYSKELYKEVCEEYVKDLNREIEEVYARFREEASLGNKVASVNSNT